MPWAFTKGLSPESSLSQPPPDQSARGLSPKGFYQKAGLGQPRPDQAARPLAGLSPKTRPRIRGSVELQREVNYKAMLYKGEASSVPERAINIVLY